MAEISKIKKETEEKMKMAIEFLDETFARIRAGRANTHILDGVRVEYYGSLVPLSNVATITTPDAKTILIQPWEKTMLKVIEKALINSNIGITPENNGEVIRLSIPPLTEERRKTLVKQTKQEAEDAKISIRNARRDAIEQIKKEVKNGLAEDIGKDAEEDIQKLHDKYIKKLMKCLPQKKKKFSPFKFKSKQNRAVSPAVPKHCTARCLK
jgi:ribosome recycling factor